MRGRRLFRGSFRDADVAWAYAAIVVIVAIVVRVLPRTRTQDLVLETSTNLDNLRHTPLLVLGASAFVVSSAWGLWILAPLVVAFAAAQRWLGRAATVIVAVLGHVGATLFVAVLLAAGINDGLLDADVAREPDVGVSYGLAAVAGVLVGRVPHRWRPWYALGVLAVAAASLLPDGDFTGVGHVTAVLLGFALAVLTSARRARTPAEPTRPA
ncbi:MAG TPA: rhomboid-like protein [Mycobacteriales bacterium]|nr:rhomboid-like protein [Mycobacteriales bacterium]